MGIGVGEEVGVMVGRFVGIGVGEEVGAIVGELVGRFVGIGVGEEVGATVGEMVGRFVGIGVGEEVGLFVDLMTKVGVFEGVCKVESEYPGSTNFVRKLDLSSQLSGLSFVQILWVIQP